MLFATSSGVNGQARRERQKAGEGHESSKERTRRKASMILDVGIVSPRLTAFDRILRH